MTLAQELAQPSVAITTALFITWAAWVVGTMVKWIIIERPFPFWRK